MKSARSLTVALLNHTICFFSPQNSRLNSREFVVSLYGRSSLWEQSCLDCFERALKRGVNEKKRRSKSGPFYYSEWVMKGNAGKKEKTPQHAFWQRQMWQVALRRKLLRRRKHFQSEHTHRLGRIYKVYGHLIRIVLFSLASVCALIAYNCWASLIMCSTVWNSSSR